MTSVLTSPDAVVAHLLGELELLATTPYGGEVVDQQAHALQAAQLAEQGGGSDELVAAALLHDLGYSRVLRAERPGLAHEESAAAYLRPLLGDRVADLVGSHVVAKRVLVSIEPEYAALLSAASVSSLRAQGGPASPAEVAEVTGQPWWPEARKLREYDDQAKIEDLPTPPPSHYAPLLRRLAETAAGG